MHHLVQHRVLDFRPGVPRDVSPAQRQLERPATANVHREVAQPAPHSAGKSDVNLSECPAEVSDVELPVQRFQSVEQSQVAWAWSLLSRPSFVDGVGLNRKFEKRALGLAAEWTGNPRIEEPYNGLQHVIRRKCIAAVNPEHPAPEAQHDGPIGVGQDAFDLTEAESVEACRKIVFEEIALTSCTAVPLPRRQSP
jgi:hypothetical protein